MELLFTTTLLPSVLFPCRLNALAQEHLIDLLHLGALIVLERREVIIVLISVIFLSSVVNAEAELDHAVDAASKGDRLIQGEARCEQGGVEQQPDKVLDSLVVLVLVGTCTESVDDGVQWVHLHSLLRCHVAGHGAVLEGLSLHDALHVGRPAILAEHLLHELAKALTGSLLLLELFLLVLCLLELEALLGDSGELLAVVLLELLNGVLIDWVHHEQHFVATLLELLEEWSGLDLSL